MALYSHQSATLGDLEGTGYLFRKRTALGDRYSGVFFGPEGETETLKSLVEADVVPFSGTLYKKDRAGKISSVKIEIPVDVTGYAAVSMGDRAVLQAVPE